MNGFQSSRRDFLKLTIGTTLGYPFVLNAQGRSRGDTGGPNLLIIQTDEHNFRTLGCYRRTLTPDQAFVWGPEAVVETPNIDWLAEQGALCTRFYATTPVCSPSRSSFVSGRYPQNTPVVSNNIPMADDTATFAEILGQRGYACGYAGKWHLDGSGKPQWEPKRRFGFADNRYMFNRGHWKQLEDTPEGPRVAARDKNDKPTYSIEGATELNFTTDFLTDTTIDFIKSHEDQSFCYMVSYPDPHGPNTVRAPYDVMFNHVEFETPRTADKPDAGLPSWGKKARNTISDKALAKYFGMVKCIDDNVGRLLDTLRQLNLLDNTIVVFTADHGDLCGEHSRDNKGVPYEASAKIPLVLYYPTRVPAETLVHEALSSVDFLPTVLRLMEIPTAGAEEGRDASTLFMTGQAPSDWQDVAFFRGTGSSDKNWLAAVTRRYKVVYSPKDNPWLFDLEDDPDELTNYYQDPSYRDTVRHLAQSLLDYGQRCRDARVEEPSIQAALIAAATLR
ncbi:MAG: sulfatase [Phycisphaerales bacterium]|nr:MAG: sulfatase [Phycisphaerales bacterium]